MQTIQQNVIRQCKVQLQSVRFHLLRELRKKEGVQGWLDFIRHRDRYYIIISSWLPGNMAFSISEYRHYLFIDAFLKRHTRYSVAILHRVDTIKYT